MINKNKKRIILEGLDSRSKILLLNAKSSPGIDQNNFHIDPGIILIDHLQLDSKSTCDGKTLCIYDKSYDAVMRPLTNSELFVYKKIETAQYKWTAEFMKIPKYETRKRLALNQLEKVAWNSEGVHKKLRIDKEWSDKVKDHKCTLMKFKEEECAPDAIDEGLLTNWLSKLAGKRLDFDTFIHFPMIICDRSSTEEVGWPILPVGSVHHKILNKAEFKITHQNFADLSSLSRPKVTSSRVDKGDLSKPNLSGVDRESLANRGVMAKEFKKRNPDSYVHFKEKSISPNAQMDSLEDYLHESLKFDYDSNLDYILNSLDKSTKTEFTTKWFSVLLRLRESKCLHFHDRVLSEVIANSTRNLEKDTFIVRKVKGYKAYVIIRPTSLGTVNNPKPIFYSIVFKGSSLNNDVFETVHTTETGWSYTDFLSTSRIRSSHHMNSMPQFMMMIFENLETLSTLTEEPDELSIQSISEPIKWCLLAHLQDREEFSEITSNFRYYYFSLFSGFRNCKSEASLLHTKLPSVIRDPLTMLALKRLILNHDKLDSETISQQTSILSQREIRQNRDNPEIADDAEYDKLPILETPFGFSITNARSFLKASYMSLYHNKDEAERGPAAKQIVTKLCKQEHHMTNLLNSDKGTDVWNSDLNETLGVYQFNANACIYAADLLKEELLKQNGLDLNSYQARAGYDEWITESIIMPLMLRTTYDELASTRSSYVDSGEFKVSTYNSSRNQTTKAQIEENSLDTRVVVGKTMRCIEAILKLKSEGRLNEMSPCEECDIICMNLKEEGSKLVVKIFKKNQLTGVREIYILTMSGRLLQRLVEDLARGICSHVHQEKLTSPHTKDHFVSEHKSSAISKSNGRKGITINNSGDKTSWANNLIGKGVSLPLLRLLPSKFHPLIAHFFNANTKKEIEIPGALIDSFLNHPDTDLESPVLNNIKSAVLGGGVSDVASRDSSRLKLKGNTMQGIAHYCSSLYHMTALCLLRKLLTLHLNGKGLDSHMSFEVSSDDKGFMVTFFIEEGSDGIAFYNTLSISRKIVEYERLIDNLFGIRDSRFKSVMSISVSYEFNSTFYFGNSITTPIAKFTARVCDDTIQSTLHKRVSGMYSSVRQIRDNGGSGILCSLASMCQNYVMMCNLGYDNFQWFDESAINAYSKYKFSHMGYRRISSPITAGLCMSDYENEKFAHLESLKDQYKFLGREDFEAEDFPEEFSMNVKLWSRQKHEDMLKRLNLVKRKITKEDAINLLKFSESSEELDHKIELMALSSNLSRSFVQCQRSDLLRAGMYLLWHKAFRFEGDKLSFLDLVEHLDSMKPVCHELSDDFLNFLVLERKPRFYEHRNVRSRLMPRNYSPLVSYSYIRNDLVAYIRKKWFNQGDGVMDSVRSEIERSCHWITNTCSDFFENREPLMLLKLINQAPTARAKVKLLARGSTIRGSMVQNLYRDNTSADFRLHLGRTSYEVKDLEECRSYINDSCSRISLWIDILHCCDSVAVNSLCLSDINNMSKLLPYESKNHVKRSQESLIVYIFSCIRDSHDINCYTAFQLSTSNIMWIKGSPATRRQGRDFEYYINHFSEPILVQGSNNQVTNVFSKKPRISELIQKYEEYSDAKFDYLKNEITVTPIECWGDRGSLIISDGKYKIDGILGFESDYVDETFSPIETKPNINAEDLEMLKEVLYKTDNLSPKSIDLLMGSNGKIVSGIRLLIGKLMGNKSFRTFYPPTKMRNSYIEEEILNPSNITRKDDRDSVSSSEDGEIEEMPDNDKIEDIDFAGIAGELLILQKRTIEEMKALDSLEISEDEMIREDAQAFFELYDVREGEVIPGVDYLQTYTKERWDSPACLRTISKQLNQAKLTPRSSLNSGYYELIDKIENESN